MSSQQVQEQQTSEQRIGGDGEEVYLYGYSNYIQPPPQGEPQPQWVAAATNVALPAAALQQLPPPAAQPQGVIGSDDSNSNQQQFIPQDVGSEEDFERDGRHTWDRDYEDHRSGDGEEVYGSNNYLQQPVPQGAPSSLAPQYGSSNYLQQPVPQGAHAPSSLAPPYGSNNYLQQSVPQVAPSSVAPPAPVIPAAAPPPPGSGQGSSGGEGSTQPHLPPDDDSEDEYERRNVRDRRKDRDRDRDRDRDYDDRRSHRGRPNRDVDKDRDRGRREWETSRDAFSSSRPYRRDYDYDDEYERPRSRSSYYDDEHFSSTRRRRRDDSFRSRGPPSDYNPAPRARETRGPFGYSGNSGYGADLYASFGMPSRYPPSSNFDQSFPANPHAQSFQMYLATFRTQRPAEYREWYHKFVAHQQDPLRIPFPPVPGYAGVYGRTAQTGATGAIEDKSRPSSQAGQNQSAVSDRNDALFRPIVPENREPTPPARDTPPLYSSAHAFCRISSLGQFYGRLGLSRRGGFATVDFISSRTLLNKRNPDYRELRSFPGPLVKGVTHKNTIVQFCQRKIRELELQDRHVDRENLILLWDLLILLLRQNGSAIGSDIAELLLKSDFTGQSPKPVSNRESDNDEDEVVEDTKKGNAINSKEKIRSNENDEKCVDVFCQKLIYGHKQEALEFAMDNALWGHALFFSSKMDEKLYGNVLARFANSTMSLNSPLQTLYHVLSGKQPPAITCCGDEAYGDWKPHLAMILSNMGKRPEFEANTMRTLGRTLAMKNLKFAAQFCYLMAESEFADESDIGPLLGYNSDLKNVLEATQMTEIYEFARTLANPEFTLGTAFIERKLKYTEELLNFGFVTEAFSYCEEMAAALKKSGIHSREKNLANNILKYAEGLVCCDVNREVSEPTWLEELRRVSVQIESGDASRRLSVATSASDRNDDVAGTNNSIAYTPNDNQLTYETSLPQLSSLPSTVNDATTNSSHGYYSGTAQVTSLSGPNQWSVPDTTTYNPVSYDHRNSISQGSSHEGHQPMSLPVLGNGPVQQPPLDNNNYLTSYQAPQSMTDSTSATKKKMVRFEDDDFRNDTKEMHKLRQLDKLQSKVIQETAFLNPKLTSQSQEFTRSFRSNNSVDKFNNIGSLSLRELKSLTVRTETVEPHNGRNTTPVSSPIKFKSTFPIDQPISNSMNSNTFPRKLKKPSTFPIDEPFERSNNFGKLERQIDSSKTLKSHAQQENYSNHNPGSPKPYMRQFSREEQQLPTNKTQAVKKSEKKSKDDSSKTQKGWLSGMFSALSFKAKNQMILPDDKEPTIVWDESTKSWKNIKGDEDEDSAPKGPPPKDSDLMGMTTGSMNSGPPSFPTQTPQGNPSMQQPPMSMSSQQSWPQQVATNGLPTTTISSSTAPDSATTSMNGGPGYAAPPPSGAPNKFQRPKGLKLRNNYVDVFSSNVSQSPKTDEPQVPLPGASNPGVPNIFMPPPVQLDSGQTSFLTAAEENYAAADDGSNVPVNAPQMFNPAQFQNQSIPSYGHNQ